MGGSDLENSGRQNTNRDNRAGQATFYLKNANEEIVIENVRRLMSMTDMCQCERCFNDACAIVLNSMPPRYSTSRKGEMLSQLPQMTIFTISEIGVMTAKALKIVREDPNH